MAWDCVERSEGEGEGEAVFVCHHCGKPLCQRHSRIFADDAFPVADQSNGSLAVHCSSCKREHHPKASSTSVQQQWQQARGTAQR